MTEKNLLADLAAYLFATLERRDSGRTPSERELAEHFGVSRGQIRETLAILEAMRIVERRAKSGIYLTTRSGERRGAGAVCQGGRAARPDPDLRDGRTAQDPRDQGGRTRLLARDRGELRAAARDPATSERAASPQARPMARGGSRFPSRDRAGHAEQRLLQGLQRLLRHGRAPPADLFQRSRALPPVACRASPDLRGAPAARRQPRAGADERASARAPRATGRA